jgi:DNA-binding transcriptional ArsR family regulator
VVRNPWVLEFPLEQVAIAFKALAHPVRLRILDALRHTPCNISQLTRQIHEHQANISKHVAVLVRVGLIRRTRQGNRMVCRTNSAIIERLWSISGMNATLANGGDEMDVFCPEI